MHVSPISPFAAPTTIPLVRDASVERPVFGVSTSIAPAAPTLGAASEAAVDGVARLQSTSYASPIVDFPGIATGDWFDIVKGSKVGFLGVKGEAEVLKLDADNASFRIKAGAFGIKANVVVDVVRTGEATVRISSRGTGIPEMDADGRVLESRTNYAEFERSDIPEEHTIIRHDGNGRVEIDTVVPNFGKVHLVLAKRR